MRIRVLLAFVLLFASGALAQNPVQPQPATHSTVAFTLQNPPVPPSNLNVHLVGQPGFSSVTLYYWLVSEFPIGNSPPSGPWTVFGAPNTLSGSNYEALSFPPVAGASSYDVLKTTTPFPPTGACNCAVAVATTSNILNDQSNATSSYTVNTLSPTAYLLQLDNEATGTPGVSHLILRQNGGFVNDLSSPSGGGSGCQVNPADGGCAIAGTPSVDIFVGAIGGGTAWLAQFISGQLNVSVPANWNLNTAGVISLGCNANDPGLGSGVGLVGPSSCTPFNFYMPQSAGSGFVIASNSANKVTLSFESNIDLTSDVGSTILPLVNGGTGQSTKSGALTALLNTATRNGDLCCFWSGTAYVNLAGNNAGSGGTGFVTENGTGSPGFVLIPIPVADGGFGLITLTPNTVYKGNGTSAPLATKLSENTAQTALIFGAQTIQSTANTFATLTAAITCNSGAEGSRAPVTDSTTNTWGATITGSGSNHVLAYCDGTNWTVTAK